MCLLLRRLAVVPIVAALGACASAGAPPLPAVPIGFLVDGASTQAECIERLGAPQRRFAAAEGGVVFTYRLGEDGAGLHPVPASASWFDYARRRSLVLVFDARGTLARHALVAVRGG